MKKNYEWQWLDEVISFELNLEKKGTYRLSNEETNQIKERIALEERAVLSRLKNRVFSIQDEPGTKSLVKKYHDDLIIMIAKNYDNLHHPSAKEANLRALHEYIGSRLQIILQLFEKELAPFLDHHNQVPLTTLVLIKTEIIELADEMKEKLATGKHGLAPVDIVMEVIYEFLSKIDQRLPVSIREAMYIKELVQDVIHIDGELASITGCPALNELLITWNLNSKTCIRYFTQGTEHLMNSYSSDQQKLNFLKLESKKLDNIPERQHFILDPNFPSVKEYCSKWLKNEIEYRETRLEGFAPIAVEEEKKERKSAFFKVMLSLSVDQFSMILRAADALRIVSARSMRTVFKAVVPFISTDTAENPSWENARSAAYKTKEPDKKVVVETLHKMIKWIEAY